MESNENYIKIYGGFIEFDKSDPDKINIINTNDAELNNEGLYECNICNRKYVKKDYYKRHIKSHYDKFECKICKKKFMHGHHLNQHMITHKENKEYSCHICGTKITFKFNLKKHMNTHDRYYINGKEFYLK